MNIQHKKQTKTKKSGKNKQTVHRGQGNSSVCVRQKEIDVYSLYVLVLAE